MGWDACQMPVSWACVLAEVLCQIGSSSQFHIDAKCSLLAATASLPEIRLPGTPSWKLAALRQVCSLLPSHPPSMVSQRDGAWHGPPCCYFLISRWPAYPAGRHHQ